MASGDGRYITIQDVKDDIPDAILKWLTYGANHSDEQPSVWTIDDAKIARAIARAEDNVDTKISKRYRVPIDLVALTDGAARETIREAALLLTWHALYSTIGHGDEVKSKLAQALSTLDAIAKGDRELPGAEAQARARTRYTAPKSIFSRNISSNTDRESNLED